MAGTCSNCKSYGCYISAKLVVKTSIIDKQTGKHIIKNRIVGFCTTQCLEDFRKKHPELIEIKKHLRVCGVIRKKCGYRVNEEGNSSIIHGKNCIASSRFELFQCFGKK